MIDGTDEAFPWYKCKNCGEDSVGIINGKYCLRCYDKQ